MRFQYTPYSGTLIVTAVISAVVAFIAWRRRATPGGTPLALLMLAVTEWALVSGLEAAKGRILMYLVLLGPPGSGKGTQAERLKEQLRLPHVASGDLFRENIGNETELGLLAEGYIDQGELVPDDVTIAMVRERLQRPDCAQGAILDGFPRTLAQAESLDKMLADMGRKLDGVLYIAVPDEELVQRLSGRRICRQCQTPCHTSFSSPAEEGVCDECGGDLYQRDDD